MVDSGGENFNSDLMTSYFGNGESNAFNPCDQHALGHSEEPLPTKVERSAAAIDVNEGEGNSDKGNACKSLLFYHLFPVHLQDTIPTPAEETDFQKSICTSLSLCGRIRCSVDGLNVVLTGSQFDLNSYVDEVNAHGRLHGWLEGDEAIQVKWGAMRDDIPVEGQLFRELRVQVSGEVVSIGEVKIAEKEEKKKRRRGRNKGTQAPKNKNESDEGYCQNCDNSSVTNENDHNGENGSKDSESKFQPSNR